MYLGFELEFSIFYIEGKNRNVIEKYRLSFKKGWFIEILFKVG